jgi:hypothetical protein
MADLLRLAAGGLADWTLLGFTAADFNSLANNSFVLASSSDNNATDLDLGLEISYSFVNGATTTTAASRFDLYFLPLNQDGTTYGDGATSGATLPGATYRIGTSMVRSGITSGQTITGSFVPRPWPSRAAGKFAIANRLGGALNASAAAVIKARGYRLNLNG